MAVRFWWKFKHKSINLRVWILNQEELQMQNTSNYFLLPWLMQITLYEPNFSSLFERECFKTCLHLLLNGKDQIEISYATIIPYDQTLHEVPKVARFQQCSIRDNLNQSTALRPPGNQPTTHIGGELPGISSHCGTANRENHVNAW